jgi:hypothetical protein
VDYHSARGVDGVIGGGDRRISRHQYLR